MDTKSFNKQLISIATPLALQNLLSALVGASDALMLGRLSQDAVSAVSLANQVSFVMFLFIWAVIRTSGTLFAQYYSKKDIKNVKNIFSMSLRYIVVISLVFFVVSYLFPHQLMRFFTKDANLIQIGAEYLKIVCFSYLFNAISQLYLMLMKVDNRVKLSVIISIVTVAVDMLVDFFLIYGIAGAPALGANGSAYSTIAVEVVCFVLCVLDSYRKGHIHIDKENIFFFSKLLEKDAWKIAIGTLASSLLWGLSMTIHSVIMGHLGSDATAASSVVGVAQSMIQCLCQGLGGGAGIIFGKLLGQNLFDEAKKHGKDLFKVALICGLINVGLTAVLGPIMILFYKLEPLATEYLIYMLCFTALYLFATSFNSIITVGLFPAGGDSRYDAYSVVVATWLIAIPLSLFGCFVFKWPVMVTYMVMCSDEIIKVPFIKLRYEKYIWLKNLTHENI